MASDFKRLLAAAADAALNDDQPTESLGRPSGNGGGKAFRGLRGVAAGAVLVAAARVAAKRGPGPMALVRHLPKPDLPDFTELTERARDLIDDWFPEDASDEDFEDEEESEDEEYEEPEADADDVDEELDDDEEPADEEEPDDEGEDYEEPEADAEDEELDDDEPEDEEEPEDEDEDYDVEPSERIDPPARPPRPPKRKKAKTG
jgi:hypothetical protein